VNVARGASKTWLGWLGCLLCCLVSSPAPLPAAEAQRPRALILVDSASDRALVERLRGQVSDLDFDLVVVEGSPARAAALSLELHAIAVVWVVVSRYTSSKSSSCTVSGSPKARPDKTQSLPLPWAQPITPPGTKPAPLRLSMGHVRTDDFSLNN